MLVQVQIVIVVFLIKVVVILVRRQHRAYRVLHVRRRTGVTSVWRVGLTRRRRLGFAIPLGIWWGSDTGMMNTSVFTRGTGWGILRSALAILTPGKVAL